MGRVLRLHRRAIGCSLYGIPVDLLPRTRHYLHGIVLQVMESRSSIAISTKQCRVGATSIGTVGSTVGLDVDHVDPVDHIGSISMGTNLGHSHAARDVWRM